MKLHSEKKSQKMENFNREITLIKNRGRLNQKNPKCNFKKKMKPLIVSSLIARDLYSFSLFLSFWTSAHSKGCLFLICWFREFSLLLKYKAKGVGRFAYPYPLEHSPIMHLKFLTTSAFFILFLFFLTLIIGVPFLEV